MIFLPDGLGRIGEVGEEGREGRSLLFVNKKKQKNFIR